MLLMNRRSRQISFAVEKFQETKFLSSVPHGDGYVNEASDKEEEASDSANAADLIDEEAQCRPTRAKKREVKLVDKNPNTFIEIKLSENLALA